MPNPNSIRLGFLGFAPADATSTTGLLTTSNSIDLAGTDGSIAASLRPFMVQKYTQTKTDEAKGTREITIQVATVNTLSTDACFAAIHSVEQLATRQDKLMEVNRGILPARSDELWPGLLLQVIPAGSSTPLYWEVLTLDVIIPEGYMDFRLTSGKMLGITLKFTCNIIGKKPRRLLHNIIPLGDFPADHLADAAYGELLSVTYSTTGKSQMQDIRNIAALSSGATAALVGSAAPGPSFSNGCIWYQGGPTGDTINGPLGYWPISYDGAGYSIAFTAQLFLMYWPTYPSGSAPSTFTFPGGSGMSLVAKFWDASKTLLSSVTVYAANSGFNPTIANNQWLTLFDPVNGVSAVPANTRYVSMSISFSLSSGTLPAALVSCFGAYPTKNGTIPTEYMSSPYNNRYNRLAIVNPQGDTEAPLSMEIFPALTATPGSPTIRGVMVGGQSQSFDSSKENPLISNDANMSPGGTAKSMFDSYNEDNIGTVGAAMNSSTDGISGNTATWNAYQAGTGSPTWQYANPGSGVILSQTTNLAATSANQGKYIDVKAINYVIDLDCDDSYASSNYSVARIIWNFTDVSNYWYMQYWNGQWYIVKVAAGAVTVLTLVDAPGISGSRHYRVVQWGRAIWVFNGTGYANLVAQYYMNDAELASRRTSKVGFETATLGAPAYLARFSTFAVTNVPALFGGAMIGGHGMPLLPFRYNNRTDTVLGSTTVQRDQLSRPYRRFVSIAQPPVSGIASATLKHEKEARTVTGTMGISTDGSQLSGGGFIPPFTFNDFLTLEYDDIYLPGVDIGWSEMDQFVSGSLKLALAGRQSMTSSTLIADGNTNMAVHTATPAIPNYWYKTVTSYTGGFPKPILVSMITKAQAYASGADCLVIKCNPATTGGDYLRVRIDQDNNLLKLEKITYVTGGTDTIGLVASVAITTGVGLNYVANSYNTIEVLVGGVGNRGIVVFLNGNWAFRYALPAADSCAGFNAIGWGHGTAASPTNSNVYTDTGVQVTVNEGLFVRDVFAIPSTYYAYLDLINLSGGAVLSAKIVNGDNVPQWGVRLYPQDLPSTVQAPERPMDINPLYVSGIENISLVPSNDPGYGTVYNTVMFRQRGSLLFPDTTGTSPAYIINPADQMTIAIEYTPRVKNVN